MPDEQEVCAPDRQCERGGNEKRLPSSQVCLRNDMLPGLDEPDARGHASAERIAECAELGRVHHVVYHKRIAAVRGILQDAAQSEVTSTEMKAHFKPWAEVRVSWKV